MHCLSFIIDCLEKKSTTHNRKLYKSSKFMKLRSFNATHRLLHWSISLCFILLLGTALLHITWFGRDNLAKIIQENLLLWGDQVTPGDANILAKCIAQPMWNWHFYAGDALIGLYILRLVHFAFYGMLFPNPFMKNTTLNKKVQGFTYIIFYMLLGITILTGSLMMWGPTKWRWISQIIHYQSHYYAIAFILMHFGGIIVSEFYFEKGVVSKMLHS